ncbi:Na(+) H(+) antiporter subunit A / Na(+) H(+) antiporter subunit B [Halarchaeum acidiphilum MH1-52-1]|uniref:Na(+) H(+) antiporter subunit A / Na(+) H(+) antiporter subunit B n=1 Tax=Halarchaeum acidiphilum MH1-52-1 TaxID=1261545 RepID=U3ABD4_9EURY|nr:MnhB domain-containing protein [Halarchaeum acidiphilum]GAD52078.1 Na(+) H(+) antiporter subunit A / Na(+) H(+) antiporter subunit B [Halarchaeum acidiphilum MH1-52-1]
MTLILRTVTRVVLPLGFVVSFAFFLQGHNLPGGGFIAGVLTASVVALAYLAYGLDGVEHDVLNREVQTAVEHVEHVQHGIVRDYQTLYAAGLALAVVAGLVAILYGVLTGTHLTFMTQTYRSITVPLYGHVELASAVVFDLGVYAVVVGALLTVISVVGAE